MNRETENSEYALQLCRYFIRPLGLWAARSNFDSWIHATLLPIAILFIIFVEAPLIMFTLFEASNIMVKIKLLGLNIFVASALAKYIGLIKNSTGINECIQLIEEDWKFSSDVEKKVRYQNLLSINQSLFVYKEFQVFISFLPPW